ncbi:MAG: hypothetical protein WCT02_00510 [Candidatus Paceibacterota bacterium]
MEENIVISGFVEFGDYVDNITAQIARDLKRKVLDDFKPHRIHSVIFPATIPDQREDRGQQLFKLAAKTNSKAIIALGMSSSLLGPCIEHVAYNSNSGKYCPPELVGTPVCRGYNPDQTFKISLARWDLKLFQSICKDEGIQASFSSKPGGFCCNHLMVQLCLAQLSNPVWQKIPWIFLHLPCSPEAVASSYRLEFRKAGKKTMTVETAIQIVKILIASLRRD